MSVNPTVKHVEQYAGFLLKKDDNKRLSLFSLGILDIALALSSVIVGKDVRWVGDRTIAELRVHKEGVVGYLLPYTLDDAAFKEWRKKFGFSFEIVAEDPRMNAGRIRLYQFVNFMYEANWYSSFIKHCVRANTK
jgi:hypothetical protein